MRLRLFVFFVFFVSFVAKPWPCRSQKLLHRKWLNSGLSFWLARRGGTIGP